jgi:putative ABC transport system ATP-binding protein
MTHSSSVPVLEAHGLAAVVRGDAGDVRVLDGTSLTAFSGEVVDIVGESGVGKTTLLRVLARLLPSATGQIALDGEPAEHIAPELWRTRVALLPQKPALVPGDVRSNLLMPWALKVRHAQTAPSDAVLRAQLDGLGMADVALDRDVARLSVGQSARVAFARTMLTEPRVLLLDEADAALDEVSAGFVSEATRAYASEGCGVVRVRHRGSDGLASRRLRLAGGRLEEVPT